MRACNGFHLAAGGDALHLGHGVDVATARRHCLIGLPMHQAQLARLRCLQASTARHTLDEPFKRVGVR